MKVLPLLLFFSSEWALPGPSGRAFFFGGGGGNVGGGAFFWWGGQKSLGGSSNFFFMQNLHSFPSNKPKNTKKCSPAAGGLWEEILRLVILITFFTQHFKA